MCHVNHPVHFLSRYRGRFHWSPRARQKSPRSYLERRIPGGDRWAEAGKTSLVRTALDGLSNRTVIELDLSTTSRLDATPGAILVLENLDNLSDTAIETLLADMATVAAASVVVTGGRRLRTVLGRTGTVNGLSFRPYPSPCYSTGRCNS